MSMRPHYCCVKCGFKLSNPNDKCIACGCQNSPSFLNVQSYGNMPEKVKIQVSLHQDGSRLTDKEEFSSIDDMISWLLKEKKKLGKKDE